MRFMVVVSMPVAAVFVMVVRVAMLIIHRCPLDSKKSSFCLIPVIKTAFLAEHAEDAE
jgi:hypothetical protein